MAAFLQKVSAACQNDNEVPGFVGAQVNEWLAEIMAGGGPGGSGETDENAAPAQVAGSDADAGAAEGESGGVAA